VNITHDAFSRLIIDQYVRLNRQHLLGGGDIEFLGAENVGGDLYHMIFEYTKYGLKEWREAIPAPLTYNAGTEEPPPNFQTEQLTFYSVRVVVPTQGVPEVPRTPWQLAKYYFLGKGWRYGIMRIMIARELSVQLPQMMASYIHMYFESQMMWQRAAEIQKLEKQLYPSRSRPTAAPGPSKDWGIHD